MLNNRSMWFWVMGELFLKSCCTKSRLEASSGGDLRDKSRSFSLMDCGFESASAMVLVLCSSFLWNQARAIDWLGGAS